MSIISFKSLNDLRVLKSDAYQSLEDGADICEITQKLIGEISNEAARVFGLDPITVEKHWLDIEWVPWPKVSLFNNVGIFSSSGKLQFSPMFLTTMINMYGSSVLVGILAHEVGHRMVYLWLTSQSVRLNAWENEYCADYIAGLLIRLAQCDPNGMKAFYQEICKGGSSTHPPGKYRVLAFQCGYEMIDHHSRTVFLRNPLFATNINTRQIFTNDFMRKCLLQEVILPLRK